MHAASGAQRIDPDDRADRLAEPEKQCPPGAAHGNRPLPTQPHPPLLGRQRPDLARAFDPAARPGTTSSASSRSASCTTGAGKESDSACLRWQPIPPVRGPTFLLLCTRDNRQSFALPPGLGAARANWLAVAQRTWHASMPPRSEFRHDWSARLFALHGLLALRCSLRKPRPRRASYQCLSTRTAIPSYLPARYSKQPTASTPSGGPDTRAMAVTADPPPTRYSTLHPVSPSMQPGTCTWPTGTLTGCVERLWNATRWHRAAGYSRGRRAGY